MNRLGQALAMNRPLDFHLYPEPLSQVTFIYIRKLAQSFVIYKVIAQSLSFISRTDQSLSLYIQNRPFTFIYIQNCLPNHFHLNESDCPITSHLYESDRANRFHGYPMMIGWQSVSFISRTVCPITFIYIQKCLPNRFWIYIQSACPITVHGYPEPTKSLGH